MIGSVGFVGMVWFLMSLLAVGCGDKEANRSEGTQTASGQDSVIIQVVAGDSSSVLELTRRSHEVQSRGTALGTFVTAIDSIENSSKAYWIYSVNRVSADVASDKMRVGPGDTVRWHLRRVDEQ